MPDALISYPRIPEPVDGSIVLWKNGAGQPVGVHVRIDSYTDADSRDNRWFNADEERGMDEYPESWDGLCKRLGELGNDGPFPVTVGDKLTAEVPDASS